ncbi:metal ABC transporter substrate-binding protein [Thermotoga sp.]|uniref:metal ABC transporter substrate-binding protein n=1 Tax=Thermotoga sp. TaxID=28240 RepID=UPI0025FA77F9|nr:metal ABC transporter substrate-binding protein [Thermotoga sp.]MCD6551916.1 zinc ABC transporter substrate-binding protein [Thermotoga sp.]
MKKLFLSLILALSLVSFAGKVVVTINPYYLIVSQLFGDSSNVVLLVPPNANPHLFSLKPTDAKTLEEADLIVANGMGLEPYLKRYSEKTVYVSDFVPEIFLEDENPHIWLDPFFLKYYIVPGLYRVLSEKFPKKQKEIRQNTKQAIEELSEVIIDSFNVLFPHRGKIVVMPHPSFLYLFKEFDLKLLPLSSGHEHSTSFSTIKEILEKKEQIAALFREPQQPGGMLTPLEKELKLKSFVLDPLGVDGEKKISELLRKNLETIKEALK